MARPVSSIGLRGEVSFGADGYLHADRRWNRGVDFSGTPGTAQPGVTTNYRIGDVVIYQNTLWQSLRDDNDNVEPGSQFDRAGVPFVQGTAQPYWQLVSGGGIGELASPTGNNVDVTVRGVGLGSSYSTGGLVLLGGN